jgi:hypothetical protein
MGTPMPLEIEDIAYFNAADIQRDLGVARQTLHGAGGAGDPRVLESS